MRAIWSGSLSFVQSELPKDEKEVVAEAKSVDKENEMTVKKAKKTITRL